MIVCPRCSKQNQDHYKFCLGCGAELPRDRSAPNDFSPTPPPAAPAPAGAETAEPVGGGDPAPGNDTAAPKAAGKDKGLQFAATQQGDAVDAAVDLVSRDPSVVPRVVSAAPLSAGLSPAAAQPPAPAAAADSRSCPACGNAVPVDFKFCGSCGHQMDGAPASGETSGAVPAAASVPAGDAGQGALVLINPDGSEGQAHRFEGAEAMVGRESGSLFAADSYLSPQHASFSFRAGACVVRDEGSLNGVYYKVPRDQPVPLRHGSIFRIGQEIIRFETVDGTAEVDGVTPMGSPNPGYLGRIALLVGRDTIANAYLIPPEGMHVGRERGDVVFPDDGYVSGLHCRLHADEGTTYLTDVGSSNGTFMRIDDERECQSGDLILMGQQLFRLQY